MFIQTQKTPNPNSLKFLPGKKVSDDGPYEILKKDETNNYLVRNILSINGVTGIFLSDDYLSVNKKEEFDWEDIKHIVISHINEYYSEGNKFIIAKKTVRPAVERDGGDIKFKEFKDGKVKVELQGSCSGCPSSTLTLKQGVQNLLCHYIPEVKEVLAV